MNAAEFWKRLTTTVIALSNVLAVAAFIYFFFKPTSILQCYVITLLALVPGTMGYIGVLPFLLSLCTPRWPVSKIFGHAELESYWPIKLDFERILTLFFGIVVAWFGCFMASLFEAYWMMSGLAVANMCVYLVIGLILYKAALKRESSDVEEQNMEEMSNQPVVE